MLLSNILSQKIINQFEKFRIIEEKDHALYHYCFEFVLDLLIFNGSLLIIGMFFHKSLLTILYVLSFSPIRMLAGGVHASSRSLCSIISYSIYFMVLSLSYATEQELAKYIVLLIYVFSCIIIISLTPVETSVKKFAKNTKHKLKLLCCIYLLLISILFFFLYICNNKVYYSCIMMCVCIIALGQLFEIRNPKRRYET